MKSTVTSAPRGGASVVNVAGELDMFAVHLLRDHLADLLALGRVHLITDLTAVTFIDSTGLGVLVGASEKARAHGGHLDLVVDQDRVLRLLRISALASLFVVHRTLDDALAATWAGPQPEGDAARRGTGHARLPGTRPLAHRVHRPVPGGGCSCHRHHD